MTKGKDRKLHKNKIVIKSRDWVKKEVVDKGDKKIKVDMKGEVEVGDNGR